MLKPCLMYTTVTYVDTLTHTARLFAHVHVASRLATTPILTDRRKPCEPRWRGGCELVNGDRGKCKAINENAQTRQRWRVKTKWTGILSG